MLDKWDLRFLDLAKHVSSWSKDPSTKVGAVLANSENRRVISVGFNGFPAGVEDLEERLENREIKYEMVVHAEQNALLFAGDRDAGCTQYVYPLPSCARCAVTIIQAGIVRVISPKTDRDKWGESSRIAETMFSESGVELEYADMEVS